MAVLNFPSSPSNGDTYVENGVTYTYSGTAPNGFWKADNQNIVNDTFVDVAGDTMSGNLTITPLGGGANVALYADNTGLIKASTGGESITYLCNTTYYLLTSGRNAVSENSTIIPW